MQPQIQDPSHFAQSFDFGNRLLNIQLKNKIVANFYYIGEIIYESVFVPTLRITIYVISMITTLK